MNEQFKLLTDILQAQFESTSPLSLDVLKRFEEQARKADAPTFTGGHIALLEWIQESTNTNVGLGIDVLQFIGTPRYNDYLIAKWFIRRDPAILREMKAQFDCAGVDVPSSMLWATQSLCQQYPHFAEAWNALPMHYLEERLKAHIEEVKEQGGDAAFVVPNTVPAPAKDPKKKGKQ